METKRNIKKENEIINNIVEKVKKAYVLQLNNYSNYEKFFNNVYNKIKDGFYDYFDDYNQKDYVMGDFCKYMVQNFTDGRPWFAEKYKDKIKSVEIKLLKAIIKVDYKKYAYEHLDEIDSKIIRMHLKNLYE